MILINTDEFRKTLEDDVLETTLDCTTAFHYNDGDYHFTWASESHEDDCVFEVVWQPGEPKLLLTCNFNHPAFEDVDAKETEIQEALDDLELNDKSTWGDVLFHVLKVASEVECELSKWNEDNE